MAYLHDILRKTEELANAPTLGNLHPDARAQAIARAAMAERSAAHPAPQAPDTRIEQLEALLRKSGEALRTVLNATWEDQDGLTVFCEDKLPAHAYTAGHTAIAAIDAHLIAAGKKRLPHG